VEIGRDTVVLPHTHLRGKSKIGSGCTLGPNTLVEHSIIADDVHVWYSVVRDCSIGKGVSIGPFAHLRGGASVEPDARIGNFVELKNTRLGRGAKAQHLAYLGDADVGDAANIGAGTITCNYDGVRKNKTKIGKRAFIGSNSSLVAPIEIGDDAMTGAGAVVLRDVPAGERVVGNPAHPIKSKKKQ
jgi:bifunctional UDP-N-acetylglucosamine pyrophosphorylase/glucosamine-1-phosphate N-acetyltransferase